MPEQEIIELVNDLIQQVVNMTPEQRRNCIQPQHRQVSFRARSNSAPARIITSPRNRLATPSGSRPSTPNSRSRSTSTERSSNQEFSRAGLETLCNFLYHILDTQERRVITSALTLNFIRDFFWAYGSVEEYGLTLHQTNSSSDQWIAQQTYCTVIPFLFILFLSGYAICKGNNKFFCTERPVQANNSELIDILLKWFGASASISTWNAGLSAGTLIGQYAFPRATPNQIGFFSSIFTGLAEGSTQALAPYLMEQSVRHIISWCRSCSSDDQRALEVGLLSADYLVAIEEGTGPGNRIQDGSTRRQLSRLPTKALQLKDIFKNIFLSIGPGAVPGAIWQVVFVACSIMKLPAYLTAIFVSLSVLIMNFLFEVFLHQIS